MIKFSEQDSYVICKSCSGWRYSCSMKFITFDIPVTLFKYLFVICINRLWFVKDWRYFSSSNGHYRFKFPQICNWSSGEGFWKGLTDMKSSIFDCSIELLNHILWLLVPIISWWKIFLNAFQMLFHACISSKKFTFTIP